MAKLELTEEQRRMIDDIDVLSTEELIDKYDLRVGGRKAPVDEVNAQLAIIRAMTKLIKKEAERE